MQEEEIESTGGKMTYLLLGIGIVVLIVGLLLFFLGNEEDEQSVAESAEQVLVIPQVTTQVPDDKEPANYDFAEQLQRYGQDEWNFTVAGEPLPELGASDAEYSQDLLTLSAQLKQVLFKRQQIRKTVFSINDIAQGLRPPAKRLREIAFKQPFSVTQEGGKMYISAQAYHRYDRLAQAINSIDKQGAVALYNKYLPLFQLVFDEFSFPKNYQVLDSIKAATGKIIQAPVIDGRIEVIRPTVRYKFADPALEKLSALDKQMLRMGPENTRMIQKKLRELIQALIENE